MKRHTGSSSGVGSNTRRNDDERHAAPRRTGRWEEEKAVHSGHAAGGGRGAHQSRDDRCQGRERGHPGTGDRGRKWHSRSRDTDDERRHRSRSFIRERTGPGHVRAAFFAFNKTLCDCSSGEEILATLACAWANGTPMNHVNLATAAHRLGKFWKRWRG